jgi:hypothetical protein
MFLLNIMGVIQRGIPTPNRRNKPLIYFSVKGSQARA